jgi:hypothetical protein
MKYEEVRSRVRTDNLEDLETKRHERFSHTKHMNKDTDREHDLI